MQRLMAEGKLSKTPDVGLAAGEGKVKVDIEIGGREAVPKSEESGATASGASAEVKKAKKEKKGKKGTGDEGGLEAVPTQAALKVDDGGDDFFED
jgi:hypothetical protein